MRRSFLPALALCFFLSPPTWSQTNPPAATPPVDQVAVPIWPTAAVMLPEAQPTPAAFALGKIDGVAPELLSGVTAKGYARKVSVEGQVIGQVLVTTVARGDREEQISAEGLAAQFDAKDTSQLFPEKTVQVQGSKSALVAALQRLASPKKEEAKKEPPKDDVSQNTVSGTGPKNDVASGYQSPTVSAMPAPEEKEPVVDNRVTAEGCPVRIDTVQEIAVKQSKLQTFTDGALTTDGPCTDSAETYPIKRSYANCPVDILDVANLQAWPQFSLYYVDGAGETHPVGECTKDTDSPYTIIEDEKQCPISLDFATSRAVPQAALVYTNRNNAPVQARGCADSTKSAAIPMVESTANCPLRNDFPAGKSYERSMWTYTRDGLTYQAAPCGDTGRVFPQETVYADLAGAYLCTPITNMTNKTVTLQSRIRVTIDGAQQWVTDCTPDTSTKGIFSTTDGCMDPSKWTHDISNSVSYGQERFWYAKADGSREYVTQCQTSTVTYPHSLTITGYQHHDDQLWAYPLSTVTISVGGTPYTVASSEVLPGAPQMTYVLAGTVDQPTGQSNYDGCNAYRETAKYERWTRPDGSEYLKPVGGGAPTGPVNVCVASAVGSQAIKMRTKVPYKYYNNWSCGLEGCSGGEWWDIGDEYKTISKSETRNYETGVIVSSACQVVPNTTTYAFTGNCGPLAGYPACGSPPVLVPDPPTSCPF